MEELLTCSVCCERYEEQSRHPVLLPRCGHSFCRSCVGLLSSFGCIICPTCRADQRIESADRLPTEYTLLAIIRAQESRLLEICTKHSASLSFWCRSCSQATCGECLFEDHPTYSHDVVRATTYINEMKQSAHDVAMKFIEALDDREHKLWKIIFNSTRRISNAIRNISNLRKDMEEARELLNKMRAEQTISTATSLAETAKFLGLKWNIQECNSQTPKNVKKLFVLEEEAANEEQEKTKDSNDDEDDNNNKKQNEGEKGTKGKKSIKNESVDADKTEANEPSLATDSQESSVKKSESESNTKDIEVKTKERSPKNNALSKSKTLSSIDISAIKDSFEATKEKNEESQKASSDSKEKKCDEANKLKSDMASLKPRGRLARKALADKIASFSQNYESEPAKTDSSQKTEDNSANKDQANAASASHSVDKETPEEEGNAKEGSPNPSTSAPETDTDQSSDEKVMEEPKQDTKSVDLGGEDKNKDGLEFLISESKGLDFLQVPGFMIAVEGENGRLAQLNCEPNGIHIHCHQFHHVPYDLTIKASILHALIPSRNPVSFLEISVGERSLGKVYIQLWGHMRRAHNFLSLCLGDTGLSYQNTKLLELYNAGSPGERVLCGDFEFDNGTGGRCLIDDLEWSGDYSMAMEAGMVTAAGSGQPSTNSLFLLCTQSDPSRNFSCPFGVITSGLQVVKEAMRRMSAQANVWISDCGVLLKSPKF